MATAAFRCAGPTSASAGDALRRSTAVPGRFPEDVVFHPLGNKKRVVVAVAMMLPPNAASRFRGGGDADLSSPVDWGEDAANLRVVNGDLSRSLHVFRGFLSDCKKTAQCDFLKAFALASSVMFILPLEALAETCEADSSFAKMPLFIAVALVGAAVGGLLARQRKEELKRLNDQLRQINTALRRQAKIESFAPSLTYAPVGRTAETEVIVDPRKQQLMAILRAGKNFLRNQDPDKAEMEFKAAFELAHDLGDHLEKKKAARGLGASLQRLGKYREAIKFYSKVLELSKRTREDSGCTEAYGAIADCYAELGDLERAAKFYDKYILRLER